ncbi:MAG: 2-dehydropantoate 2-reductase [Chloroflexi bacterium]|nr:2-dehydropantoate 2-reductase [Chloroflexota bacterium]
MKVTLLGTGAMACLMGYRLAPWAEVTLLGTWQDAVEAISTHGLVVDDGCGEQTIRVRATTEARDCAASDLLLVLVKAWQTADAVRRAGEALAEEGLALTLQNGIGNYEMLSAVFGAERAAAGATTSGATLVAPGHIRLGGEGALQLGDHPHLGKTLALFERAGLRVTVGADRDSILWGKLLINAAINPLAALLRVPNGELARRPSARALLQGLAREGAQVANRSAITLPYADAATRALEVAEATAHNRSSMLQDVERGRRTEIDAINGAIVNQAQRLGLDAPLNRAAWHLVQALEERPAA